MRGQPSCGLLRSLASRSSSSFVGHVLGSRCGLSSKPCKGGVGPWNRDGKSQARLSWEVVLLRSRGLRPGGHTVCSALVIAPAVAKARSRCFPFCLSRAVPVRSRQSLSNMDDRHAPAWVQSLRRSREFCSPRSAGVSGCTRAERKRASKIHMQTCKAAFARSPQLS